MRLIFSIVVIAYLFFGTFLIIMSFSENITLAIANFSVAVFGFGMIGIAMIVGLLIGILSELKNKTK